MSAGLHQASCKSQKFQSSLHGLQELLSWVQWHSQYGHNSRAQVDQCHLQRRKKALEFGKYATVHKGQHTILEELTENGYAAMDEGSINKALTCQKTLPNVWFYSGTTLCNPRLTSPKSWIFPQLPPTLKLNRKRAETEQKKRRSQERVEDRYYTTQEYKTLSNEQKKELKDLWTHRGQNPKRRK